MRPPFSTSAYRDPSEQLILALTFLLVLLVIALTATATICLSLFFVIGVLIISYHYSRSQHQALLRQAVQVTQANPRLFTLIDETAIRLQIEPVDVFVLPNKVLNAYTFGLSSPKSIVLYSALFEVMDRDELQFILGHEMGHVRLGHTWLNSLVGGMAGIPSPPEAALLLVMALRWWNRACEYSSDRAGLLACGKPQKAVSALVKLAVDSRPPSDQSIEQWMQHIETQDDHLENQLSELFATHPMIIRRINRLRSYAKTDQYQRLQGLINQNA